MDIGMKLESTGRKTKEDVMKINFVAVCIQREVTDLPTDLP
jgi:hypothetical protein